MIKARFSPHWNYTQTNKNGITHLFLPCSTSACSMSGHGKTQNCGNCRGAATQSFLYAQALFCCNFPWLQSLESGILGVGTVSWLFPPLFLVGRNGGRFGFSKARGFSSLFQEWNNSPNAILPGTDQVALLLEWGFVAPLTQHCLCPLPSSHVAPEASPRDAV